MTTHWALLLRSFDDIAPRTLLAQHDLLQLLVDGAEPTLGLTIRIVAKPTKGDLIVSFFLICDGGRGAASLARTLQDMAAVGLLTGYNIGANVIVPEPGDTTTVELRPILKDGESLPIKPDWSQVFDLIRRRGQAITIDIRCQFTPVAAGPARAPAVLGTDSGTPLLETLASSGGGKRSVVLSTVVSEPSRTDRAFSLAIARKLYGVSCDIVPVAKPADAIGVVCSPDEALRVWHWPYGEIQGRGLGSAAPSLSLSSRIAARKGASLGTARTIGPRADREVEVVMSPQDRVKHIYIVGKTGSGKTNLLKRIARQDIAQGKGCLVISPHADLIDHLIDTAGDRADDIVLLDFGDARYAPQLNPLAIDIDSPADYSRAADQLTDLVAGLNYHEYSGPVFRDAVRTALQTAALPEFRGAGDPSIAVAVEIVRDRSLREWATKVARQSRRDIELELSLVGDLKASDVSEHTRWVTAKFSAFAVNGPLRAVTSTSGSSPMSFRDVYEKQKVLLVHLPDTYLTGESAEFVGRFIFERLYLEARRTPSAARKEFYIHADEFQRFVNRDLEVLVTEARKFRLGLAFAHQNLRQLQAFSRYEGTSSSRLAEAIFSNAGTLIAMRTSGADVAALATELEIAEHYVRRIGQHEALARATLGGEENRAFTLKVPLEEVAPDLPRRRALRRRMIAEGYWERRATVERDLDLHLQRLRSQASPIPKSIATSPRTPLQPEPSARSSRSLAKATSGAKVSRPGPGSSFLDDWLEKRAALDANQQAPVDPKAALKGKS